MYNAAYSILFQAETTLPSSGKLRPTENADTNTLTFCRDIQILKSATGSDTFDSAQHLESNMLQGSQR